MQILIAVHRSQSELLKRLRDHFEKSQHVVTAVFGAVGIKREIRRHPNGIAALIIDATFLHLAEDPQITNLYSGPIVGIYGGKKEKAALEKITMEGMGLTVALTGRLIPLIEQILKRPRRRYKTRIVACFGLREPSRDYYFKVLANMPYHDLVRCANAKEALEAVLFYPGPVALLVVGYDARRIVAKAYRSGYTGEVLGVASGPYRQEALLEQGLIVVGPDDFKRSVTKILKR